MKSAYASAYRDRELVRMLGREPELLALADALIATRNSVPAALRPQFAGHAVRQRRRRVLIVPAALTIAAAVAIFLLIASPWRGAADFSDQALAAVGDQEVLHVVVVESAAPDLSLRSLSSGQVIPRSRQTEIWFDSQRKLKNVVTTLGGDVLDEQLETPRGGSTQTGPIYTCAWIAAHPVAATKAGVSCSATGQNGTTPRTVPEQPPTIDQAIGDFVNGYQDALASGDATRVGEGTIDGHHVVWLQFNTASGSERVAIDADTYKPLLIEASKGAIKLQVTTAETLAYAAAQFGAPTPRQAQSGGDVISQDNTSMGDAASSLGGAAVWLGSDWNELRLVGSTHEVRHVRYGTKVTVVTDIKLSYAPIEPDGSLGAPSIQIYETTTCLVTVGWTCSPRDPTASDQVGAPFGSDRIQLVRHGALFVSIWALTPSPSPIFTSLALARALHPIYAP